MRKLVHGSQALRQAHLSLLHFLQLQIMYSSGVGLKHLISRKSSCIFLKPKAVGLSAVDYVIITMSPSDKLHSMIHGCAVSLHGWYGEADPKMLL